MRFTRRSILKAAAAAPALALAAAAPKSFQPTWESLKQYQCPEWFRDAKFGIWAHWGPQCVPEQGDWYARNMYIEGSPQYQWHAAHYGHPSKFGYKDIVQLWKAEKFDPENLLRRYRAAGAKYFVSMGVHHDNFDIWNSKHHPWNAARVGPKKDIVGLFARAARNHGLRFGVTEHLERSYSWFNVNKGADKQGPHQGVPYDGNDPKYKSLYFPKHDDTNSRYPRNPPDWWKQQWARRIADLVDQHRPDLLYTDGAVPFGEVGRGLLAHYYNANMQQHSGALEAVYTLKKPNDDEHGEYVEGIGVRDVERGVVDDIYPAPWQTDTCIGTWYYNGGIQYKTARIVIHMLADIVSKNGNLLLNFPLRPDGTLDPEEDQVLEAITGWMGVNGEAIHATRPWKIFGEGPARQEKSGHFNERNFRGYTASDFRFTVKGKTLYAICMGWPEKRMVVASLAGQAGVARVEMLGVKGPLQWSRTDKGLVVEMPREKPCDYAVALRISL
jgi:alpha-L-fucosidase